jgi:competence protein ComEA
MDPGQLLDKYKLQIGLGVAGVLLLLVGGWQSWRGAETEVIVLEPEIDLKPTIEVVVKDDVVVEVAGAVMLPGVYRVAAESRVAEVLEAAGGLHEAADRLWVARMINQAEKVMDGMKVYVPATGEMDEMQSVGGMGSVGQNPLLTSPLERGRDGSVAGAGVVNLNTATQSELESLWGIGPARAKTIMDNRPYKSLEEAISVAKLPSNVVEQNVGKMGVW